jgi:hypothetical protein
MTLRGGPQPRLLSRGMAAALASFAVGCSVGQGEGEVYSGKLLVEGCYQGVFDLNPTFFGANPFGDTLSIRVQRGEEEISVSDGFTLLVNDVPEARSRLGQTLTLGLPQGVSPLGFPLPPTPNPPDASLSLYLNGSCRSKNALLMAYRGDLQFTALFSGDLNEENSDDRVTEGNLTAWVIDPREAVLRTADDGGPSFEFPEDRASVIEAWFSFVFHRGTPAQPFP